MVHDKGGGDVTPKSNIRVCLCMYVCMYVQCMFACVWVCMYVQCTMCMYVFMFVCTHVCMCVCITRVFMYVLLGGGRVTPNISGARVCCCDTQYFSQYPPGMQGNEPEGGRE